MLPSTTPFQRQLSEVRGVEQKRGGDQLLSFAAAGGEREGAGYLRRCHVDAVLSTELVLNQKERMRAIVD